ncbi:MAG: DUF1153 domain-containing protein [Rhodobacteraceae bacterium]|nr:DUF1153 domain-containing protein [Paracoccaceae bacterium]
MYLRKVNGPRLVGLPDGSTLSLADLPEDGTQRWVASRKAIVVKAVRHGLIKADDAMARYELSAEELQCWIGADDHAGVSGLKAGRLRVRTPRERPEVPSIPPCGPARGTRKS